MDTQKVGTVTLTQSRLLQRLGYRWLHTCGPERKHSAAGTLQSSRMHMCKACKSWNLSPQNHWSGYTITKMRLSRTLLMIWKMMANGWRKRPRNVPSSVPQHITPDTPKCSNIAFVVTFYIYICQTYTIYSNPCIHGLNLTLSSAFVSF